MQLKFKRYTTTKGLFGNKTGYCLEAMLLPTEDEARLIDEFGRWNTNVRISTDHIGDNDELYKPVNGLQIGELRQGRRFEFSNFNNVYYTESAIRDACTRALDTVAALATFDGTERVIELTSDGQAVVAAG